MKIFSLKKAVSFTDGRIVLEDLAYNHPYKKNGNQLIIEGKDEESKWSYTVYYDLKGNLQLVILKRHNHSVFLVSWKDERDCYEVQKIKPNGDIFCETSVYQTTSKITNKLVSKAFTIVIAGKEEEKIFTLQNNKWISEGNISQEHRTEWLKK